MSTANFVSAYQQNSVQGASPVGLVISLFDTVLRDFRRADAAISQGNVEARVFELNHALTVIAHLQSVLDFDRGADAARRFSYFYDLTRTMILSLNVDPKRDTLQKLTDMYTSMRQAWQQAESQLPR